MTESKKLNVGTFRRKLEALDSKLESIAESGAEAARPVELDQTKVGRVSRMDAIRSQAMSVETERRRVAERHRIWAALKRIDEGDYGECLNCGGMISRERLMIDPAAPLCIDCANRAEESDVPR